MGGIKHANINISSDGKYRVSQGYLEGTETHLIGNVAGLNVVRTATYVIAALDAPAHIKAQADYVCDGTADDVQIQAAINALPSGGGKINLSEGTFVFATPPATPAYDAIVYVSKSYVTIEGQGFSTIIKLVDNYNADVAGLFGTEIFTGAAYDRSNGVIFTKFRIDGNKTNNTNSQNGIEVASSDCIIDKVWVENCRAAGIHLYDTSGGQQKRNLVQNCITKGNAQGIYVDLQNNARVVNNYSGDNEYFQIWIDTTNDSVFSHNILEKISAGGYGIGFSRLCQRNIISSNRILGSLNYGVVFRDDDAYSGGYQNIVNNTVIGTTTPIGSVTVPNTFGTDTTISNNKGYIAPCEIRTASGSLTAGNANAISFAWHMPEVQDGYTAKVTIIITTPGGTAGSHLDVGIADDTTGTNRGTEFFNDLLLNTAQVNDSWVVGDGGTQTKWVLIQDSASATDGWIVGQILDANAANLVGSYYVEYIGK